MGAATARARWANWLGVAAVAAAAACIHACGGFEWAERHLMDLRFPLARRQATGQVVVVAIDPRSLQALDRWPWPRDYHATLLENLLAAGVRRVAFDIDFSSRSVEEQDGALAQALSRAGARVVLPVFSQWQPAVGGGGVGGNVVETGPLESFARQAVLATINIHPDGDGLVRRYGASATGRGEGRAALAMALAEPEALDEGPFYLDYGIDVSSIPQISYLDVLTGTLPAGLLSGRDVIVGATAIELGDQAPAPLHAALPGPVLQALAYEAITSRRTLSRIPSGQVAVALLLMAFGAGLPLQRASWRAGLAIVLAGVAVLFAASVALQRATPLMLDISPLSAAMTGWYALALVRRLDQQDLKLWFAAMRARHSELRMRHVIENCGEAIMTLDGSGRVQTFNRAAETLFGRPASRTLGLPFEELIPATPRPAPPASDPGAGDAGPHRLQVDIPSPGGGLRTLEMVVSTPRIGERSAPVVFLRDVTESLAQQSALEHQASHDALTDLPNRTLLRRRMEAALEAAARERGLVALIMLDLDRFKEINDTLGHATGDLLLCQIARRLEESIPAEATIARLGGDEFAVLLPRAGATEAEAESMRLIEALGSPFAVQGMSLQVDGSIGISLYPDHGDEAGLLLQRADVAMYQAKKQHGLLRFYDAESDVNSLRHLALKGEMKEAIDRDFLELHYQPKVNLATGETAGLEALVRWRHRRHGLLRPQEFIPLAENTGLIKPLTRWVLAEAMAQAVRWDPRASGLPVSVNCSARNLMEKDFPEAIDRLLRASGLPPERLVLEITETALIEEPSGSLQVLTDIASLGVLLSIDDFGTAYSSLDYLRKLPARELKIDRSFVVGVGRDEASTSIVRATISLAHDFGLRSVAEGIESTEVMDTLRRLGCDEAQGYVIAHPMPGAEVAAWVLSRRIAGAQTAAAMRR